MRRVKIVEVGPRDGFQNIKEFIPTEQKLRIIDRIVESGIKNIQITSFVSPKAVSQMKDARAVTESVLSKYDDLNVFALVPNFIGAKAAIEAGLKEIAIVMSLTESHNRNNVRRTREESLEETRKVRQTYPDLTLTQDIGVVFGCPFEGEMKSIDPLMELIEKVRDIGVHAFTLSDTVGMADPIQVEEVFRTVFAAFPNDVFNVHIHDTRNMGMINSLVAIQNGADSVQTSIGGLGGCPFAPGATGNTSTEDFVYMLEKCGYYTGIDFPKLLDTAKYVREQIHGNYSGHHINVSKAPYMMIQEGKNNE